MPNRPQDAEMAGGHVLFFRISIYRVCAIANPLFYVRFQKFEKFWKEKYQNFWFLTLLYGFGTILDDFKIFEKKSLKISEKVFFRDPLRGALR